MYYVETPAIASIIDVMKTTVWGESGFPARLLEQIVSVNEEILELATGFGGDAGPAEGPVWWEEDKHLLFSNGEVPHGALQSLHGGRRVPGLDVGVRLDVG